MRRVLRKLIRGISCYDRFAVNSSRYYLEIFAQAAATAVPVGARVLDAGAGIGMYKRHFSAQIYESADFCQVNKRYADITYVCDLSAIPVEDGRFDLILCSQTLEHVPDPAAVLREFHRVLRTGGQVWLTAPLYYEEHEIPYDFYRYTQYGVRRLFENAGFRILSCEWLEGYLGTLSHQLEVAWYSLPLNPAAFGGGLSGWATTVLAAVLKPLFALASLVFARADCRNRFTAAGHCKNYAVVVVKDHGASASPG